jgi:hypothetical protein
MLEDPEPESLRPDGFVRFLLVDDHDIHNRKILCMSVHGMHHIEAGGFDHLNHDSMEKYAFLISLVPIHLCYDSHHIPSQTHLYEFQVQRDIANTQSVFFETHYRYDNLHNLLFCVVHLKQKN